MTEVELLEDLRSAFVSSGIPDEQVELVKVKYLDGPGLYDALVNVERQEVAHLRYVISLVPESMWAFYAGRRNSKKLRECKMREKAEVQVRKAFRSRVLIFAKVEADEEAEQA